MTNQDQEEHRLAALFRCAVEIGRAKEKANAED